MEIKLIVIGKTATDYILKGFDEYSDRLKRYISFSLEIIPDLKNSKKLPVHLQKLEEGKQIISRINTSDYVILLDERGKQLSSMEFASFLQKNMVSGLKRLVFVIGGAYGFSDDVYNRSNSLLSLSKMTFNHEMVRLFFIEQIYRAMTILKGEPYHHE